MIMQIRLSHLIIAAGAILLFGCNKEPDPQPQADAPVLQSTDPQDGATGLEGTSLTVTLKFDRNVKKPSAQALVLQPEATISGIDAHDKAVFVTLGGLEESQTYKLTFPAGCIVSYADGVSYDKEISISFTMKAEASGEHYGIKNVSPLLSNPNAGEPARKLYSYLLDCYGSKTISGAVGGTAWETSYIDYINSQAGKYPAVVGFDYIFNNWVRGSWGPDYTDISLVKKAWQAHNIIQIGWHWCAPVSQAVAEGTTISDGDFSYNTKAYSISEALKEGTWQNKDLKRQLGQIAGYLQLLRDEGIPVLWRPLHEAAGDYGWGAWFWWGFGGADYCKQLWQYMYRLFTEDYGLDNLIWVWTAQTSRNGHIAKLADLQAWYPGDEYVDIVGADLYETKGSTQSDRFQLINDSVYGRKMVALSEFGNLLDIDGYFTEGAPWLWFMNWCNYENDQPVLYSKNADGSYNWNNSVQDWKSSLGNAHTVNRIDVPDLSTYVSPDEGWEKASTAVASMLPGWNLGNSLDAVIWGHSGEGKSVADFETTWGQPATKAALLQMFADEGFRAIRVPVTWWQKMDSDGKVREDWMARVEEVVNYVLDSGMYCILNVHHDTGEKESWLKADAAVYAETRERYISLWQQIATRFKDYGPKLVFESFNEMLDTKNTWNAPVSADSYIYINKYNQDFVNTVRATGGNNRFRNLVVNDYCASVDPTAFTALEIPEDSANGHIIAEFHSYSPYNFAMNDGTGALQTWTAACETEVENQIKTLSEIAALKGVPFIIGEYGATASRSETEMAKQAKCYVSNCKQYGAACFYWMMLSDGADRSIPKWTKPTLKNAIIQAAK